MKQVTWLHCDLPSCVTFSGSDLSPYLPTTIIYIRPPPSAPSSSPRAPQMSDTFLLSVQDCSLNELQIWRLAHGWIQSQGNGCSRLCNQPQVNTALGKASHHKLCNTTCLWHRYHPRHAQEGHGGQYDNDHDNTIDMVPSGTHPHHCYHSSHHTMCEVTRVTVDPTFT